jgi:hypothetical protein
VASPAGVAKIAWPSLRKSVSASRIWPANTAGPAEPTVTPGAFAVITRVKAKTPLVNAALDWLKQTVLSPSMLFSWSSVHALAEVTRDSGASSPG